MNFFGKKSAPTENKSAHEAVRTSVGSDPAETAATNAALDSARYTQNDINDAFDRIIRDPSLAADMKKAAERNSEAFRAIKRDIENGSANEGNGFDDVYDSAASLRSLLGIDEDLYIDGDQMQRYYNGLINISRRFKEKSSVDSVSTGADRINPFAKHFIANLDDALRHGHKLKAECCFQVLMYILNVGYRNEGITDEVALEERIKDKVALIEKTCIPLLNTITGMYQDVQSYELEEKQYGRLMEEFDKVYREVENIPESYRDEIEAIGFQASLNKYPVGNPIRELVSIFLKLSKQIAQMRTHLIQMDSYLNHLVILQSDIRDLMNFFEKQSIITGEHFNYEEHKRAMEEYLRNVDETVRTRNFIVTDAAEMNTRRMAILSELESDKALLTAGGETVQDVRNYEKVVRQNQKLKDQLEKDKADTAMKLKEMREQEMNSNLNELFNEEEPMILEN